MTSPKPREWWIYDNGEWFGSCVSESLDDYDDFNPKRKREVHHVIEASPLTLAATDMLKALNSTLEALKPYTKDGELNPVVTEVLAAITKATGEKFE